MKIRWTFVVAALLGWTFSSAAQDTVTIPKSRLQELERKEAELQKLKNNQAQPPSQAGAGITPAAPAAAPVIAKVPPSPPIASLPALKDGDLVQAADLASHYAADASVADQRYLGRTLKVQGEIERFQNPFATRVYKIVLKTPDRQAMIVCDVAIPETYKAAFTIKHGSQFVGTTPDERRVPIAQVGRKVVVEGRCKGLSDGVLRIAGSQLLSVE